VDCGLIPTYVDFSHQFPLDFELDSFAHQPLPTKNLP
jgi:hypothetical protein